MKNLGVSKDMEKKIQKWFDFSLNQNESQGMNLKDLKNKHLIRSLCFFLKLADFDVLSFLPINIQTDLAIFVHFDMLSKVKLFQVSNDLPILLGFLSIYIIFKDCEKNLLYSLVLKIKPVLFMPSDYICKKVNNLKRENLPLIIKNYSIRETLAKKCI
jgi:cyclic nucleotide gated channel beta 1